MLITLNEYKDFVKKLNPVDDVELTALIAGCSTLIQGYCGTSFTAGTKELTLITKVGQNKVLLKDPVTSVTAITLDDVSILDDILIDYNNDILIYKTGFEDYQELYVEYESNAAVPDSVKLATIKLVEYYTEKQYIQRKSNGQSNVQNFSVEPDAWPKHILVLLEEYRDVL